MADGTAKKRDPEKWARAKAKARKKMGGQIQLVPCNLQ